MNEPYASAVATTVLKLAEIPKRPSAYAGKVAVFGFKEDPELDKLDEPMIRAALEHCGAIIAVERTPGMPMKWVVHFAVHDEALVAIKTCSKTDPQLWGGLDTLYNERPYNERGW